MTTRRIGWLALATVSALFAVASLVGGVAQFGLALRDGGGLPGIVGAAAGAAISVVFWRWIGLGAWERAHPSLDPATGEPLAPSEPIGPWGWVGRFLMALLVVGLVGGGTWIAVESSRVDRDTDRLRSRIERTSRLDELSVDQVERALQAHQTWLATGTGTGEDPLVDLLRVPDAVVQDAVVVDGTARVLIRPDGDLPCIVLEVRITGAVSTDTTESC